MGVTKSKRRRLSSIYNKKCGFCGQAGIANVDHVVPKSKGGTHDFHNLLPSCITCNVAKGDMSLAEFKLSLASKCPPWGDRQLGKLGGRYRLGKNVQFYFECLTSKNHANCMKNILGRQMAELECAAVAKSRARKVKPKRKQPELIQY